MIMSKTEITEIRFSEVLYSKECQRAIKARLVQLRKQEDKADKKVIVPVAYKHDVVKGQSSPIGTLINANMYNAETFSDQYIKIKKKTSYLSVRLRMFILDTVTPIVADAIGKVIDNPVVPVEKVKTTRKKKEK